MPQKSRKTPMDGPKIIEGRLMVNSARSAMAGHTVRLLMRTSWGPLSSLEGPKGWV